jgi:hypothetical protein
MKNSTPILPKTKRQIDVTATIGRLLATTAALWLGTNTRPKNCAG